MNNFSTKIVHNVHLKRPARSTTHPDTSDDWEDFWGNNALQCMLIINNHRSAENLSPIHHFPGTAVIFLFCIKHILTKTVEDPVPDIAKMIRMNHPLYTYIRNEIKQRQCCSINYKTKWVDILMSHSDRFYMKVLFYLLVFGFPSSEGFKHFYMLFHKKLINSC